MELSKLNNLTGELAGDSGLNNLIKDKIKDRLEKALEALPNNAGNAGDISRTLIDELSSQAQNGNFKAGIDKINNLSPEKRFKLMQFIPDQNFEKIAADVNKAILEVDISSSRSIQAVRQANFNIPNQNMKELAEVLLEKYFDKDMPQYTKRKIISSVLGLSVAEHAVKLEETVLKNTDILFQKSVQFFANKSDSEAFAELGEKLKNELPKLPQSDIDYILEKSFGEQAGLLKSCKQVAAATTGVGLLCKYKGDKVFVKVQRPGIYTSIDRDSKRILQMVEGKIEAENIVRSITSGVIDEVNLVREAINYEVAKLIYEDPKIGLHIPGIVDDFKTSEKVMIMTVADGDAVSNIDIKNLSDEKFIKLGKAYETSLEKWFEKSMHLNDLEPAEEERLVRKIKEIHTKYMPATEITDSQAKTMLNVFNGDLHGGNVFVEFTDSEPGFRVTWIDWGNAHNLDLFQSRGQVELMMATISKKPEAMVAALENVMEITEEQRPVYLNKLYDLVDEAKRTGMSNDHLMNRSVSAALESGIEPPEEILNWGRGKGMLQFEVEDNLNKQMKKYRPHLMVGDLEKGFRTNKIFLQTMVKNIKKSLPAQVVSKLARQNAVVTLKSLRKFIGDYGGYLLQRYCGLNLRKRRPVMPTSN